MFREAGTSIGGRASCAIWLAWPSISVSSTRLNRCSPRAALSRTVVGILAALPMSLDCTGPWRLRRETMRGRGAHKEASDRFRVLGDVASLMDATGDAGYMMALSGDPAGAATFFAESLSFAVDLEARDRISWALLGAGNLAAEGRRGPGRPAACRGRRDPAVDARGPTSQRRRHSGANPRRAATAAWGERLPAAWEEGRALPEERAVAEARAALSAVCERRRIG